MDPHDTREPSWISQLVSQFHVEMGIEPFGSNAEEALASDRLRRKYESMLESEVAELKSHLARQEANDIGRELADLVYTAYGAALEFHIDLDEWLRRVHASNLSRRAADGTVQRRPDGKVLKGRDYVEPGDAGS